MRLLLVAGFLVEGPVQPTRKVCVVCSTSCLLLPLRRLREVLLQALLLRLLLRVLLLGLPLLKVSSLSVLLLKLLM